jgi:hypothetical protein
MGWTRCCKRIWSTHRITTLTSDRDSSDGLLEISQISFLELPAGTKSCLVFCFFKGWLKAVLLEPPSGGDPVLEVVRFLFVLLLAGSRSFSTKRPLPYPCLVHARPLRVFWPPKPKANSADFSQELWSWQQELKFSLRIELYETGHC